MGAAPGAGSWYLLCEYEDEHTRAKFVCYTQDARLTTPAGSSPPPILPQDLCGACLRLTNLRTQAQEIVRIVDQCGHNCEPVQGPAPVRAQLFLLLLVPCAWFCFDRVHACVVLAQQALTPARQRAALSTPTLSASHPLPLPAALDLDWDTSFKPLDTDGQGYNDGRMGVSAELISC